MGHGLECRFSCVAEENVLMFVVRNGLKNMHHQFLETGEHMVGDRCRMYMDAMRLHHRRYESDDR